MIVFTIIATLILGVLLGMFIMFCVIMYGPV